MNELAEHPLWNLSDEAYRLIGEDSITPEGRQLLAHISGDGSDPDPYAVDAQSSFDAEQERGDYPEDREAHLELDAGWLELAGDDYDGPGEWKTIQGTNVFMHDGVIMKGPSNIQGKHVSQLPPRSQPMSSGDHEKSADEHRAAAKEASATGEHSKSTGHIRKANEHDEHAAVLREKNAESTKSGAKAATAESKPAEKSESKPAAQPHASHAPTDEDISKAIDANKKGDHAGALTPIHKVRESIAKSHGAQFAGEHLDKRLKQLRGEKIDLHGAFEPGALSKEERAGSVQGAGESFVYAKNRK